MDLIVNITDIASRCFVYVIINTVIYQLSGDLIYYISRNFIFKRLLLIRTI